MTPCGLVIHRRSAGTETLDLQRKARISNEGSDSWSPETSENSTALLDVIKQTSLMTEENQSEYF
jgi:hypothetical protein